MSLAVRAALVAFLLALLSPQTAGSAADPPSSLQMQPDRVDISVAAGQKWSGAFKLTNTSSVPVSVRFIANDRRVQPGSRVEIMRNSRLPSSAAPWISFSPYDEPLAAKERKEFPFDVAPVDGVSPGVYTSVLMAEVVPKGPAVLAPTDRTGLLIVVNVTGSTLTHGKIVQLSSPPDQVILLPKLPRIPTVQVALPNWLRQSRPVPVSFSFVNDGTATVRAVGSVLVSTQGRMVATIPAGSADEVFPGDTADFQATWPDPPTMGSFSVTARIDLAGSRPIDESFAVEVFPWPYIPAALAPVVLLIALVSWIRRLRMSHEFEDVAYLSDDGKPRPSSGDEETRERKLSRSYSSAGSQPKPQWSKGPPAAGSGQPRRQIRGPRLTPGEAESRAKPPLPEPAPPSREAEVGQAPPSRGVEPQPALASQFPEAAPIQTALVVRQGGRSAEVERLLGAGLAAVELAAYSEACKYFTAALARDDGCVEAWLLKAGTTDSLEEAERCLRQALMLDPSNAWAVEGLRLLAEMSRR